MKHLIATLSLLLLLAGIVRASDDWNVEIVPSEVTADAKIINADPAAPFSVILTNKTAEPLRVWDESNALGCHSLTFTVIPEGGEGFTLERPLQAWPPAVPEATVVEPGKSITLKVRLGNGESEPGIFGGFPRGFRSGKATIEAHFTIRKDEFARMKWVRACRVSSAPMEVSFRLD